jgi:hypothetical protein
MAVGATLVAGWPALLRAAAEVLDPHDTHRHFGESYQATRPDPVRGAAAVVDRMAFEAAAIGGPAVPTVTHPAVDQIINGWQQAAALLRRPSTPVAAAPALTAQTSTDTTAELRVLSTLTVVAHVTQVSLQGSRPPRPLEPAEAERFRRMAQRHEHQSIHGLRGLTNPPDTTGDALAQQTSTASTTDRSIAALKQWAPVAIAAAADPRSSVQDLRRIAQAEEIATRCAVVLVAAAAERGELPQESASHLQQRLGALSQQWHQVAEQYGWVRRFASAHRTPQVRTASKSVTQTLVDATHDQPGPDGRRTQAAAVAVAARFNGGSVTPVLRAITQNSAILGELFQRIPTRTYERDNQGRLRAAFGAPEHVLRRFTLQHHAQTGAGTSPDSPDSPDVLDVPVTATGSTVVPMSAPATAVLRAAGLELARAASSAERAVDLAAGPERRRRPPLPVPLPARPAPAAPHQPPNPSTGIPR